MSGKQNEAQQESYVLQENSAMLEMLRQRGATEAKCALPKLRELPQDPPLLILGVVSEQLRLSLRYRPVNFAVGT